jgi:hypothetical protein
MRGRSITCIGLVAALLSAPPALADSIGVPGGFRVAAGNGYWLHARAFDGDPIGKEDGLFLFFSRKGSSAIYFAQKGIEVTETSIAADLGSLGSIDLHYVPTGMVERESASCDQESFGFDEGFYEGRIDFFGEDGFTSAHVSRARGEIRFLLSLVCGGDSSVEGSGGNSPGARLALRRRWARGNVSFEARKNSPSRPARFRAEIEERRDGLAIERGVATEAGADAFQFELPEQSAQLSPPAPFHGTGFFSRAPRKPGRLRGNLSVDFPGRADVSLRGSRGGLGSYVENPSHPFRPTLASRLWFGGIT